jgi:hypothetical protein
MKFLLYIVVFLAGQAPVSLSVQYNSEVECIAGAKSTVDELYSTIGNPVAVQHVKAFCTSQMERVCPGTGPCGSSVDKQGANAAVEVLVADDGGAQLSFKQFDTLEACTRALKERNAALTRPPVANEAALGSNNGRVTKRGIAGISQVCTSTFRVTCKGEECRLDEPLNLN